MATEIRVPTLGESVSEATIGRWFKKAGDTVKADEPVWSLGDRQGHPGGERPGRRRAERDHRQGRRDRGPRARSWFQISAGGAAAAPAAEPAPKPEPAKPASAVQGIETGAGYGNHSDPAPAASRPRPDGRRHGHQGPDAGRVGQRGHRGQVVQEARRRRQGRRAALRTRDRQGDAGGQCPDVRRALRHRRRGRRHRHSRRRAGPDFGVRRHPGGGLERRHGAVRQIRPDLHAPGPVGGQDGGRARHRPRRRRGLGQARPGAEGRRHRGIVGADRPCGRAPDPGSRARTGAAPGPAEDRCRARGARPHDQAAPDDRAPPEGRPEHRRHADHLQRGGHDGP